MTSLEQQSTPESRAMALAMFANAVPCWFEIANPSCENAAQWVAYFDHEENTTTCRAVEAEPMPVCDVHKAGLNRVTNPFWRTWFGGASMPCSACGTPIRLNRFEAI